MNPAPKEPNVDSYSGRFAARLRSLREKSGRTAQEMAIAVQEAGFSIATRTYYNWESGINSPPYDALPVLAALLNLKSPRNLMPQK